jgi:hypothetical protein
VTVVKLFADPQVVDLIWQPNQFVAQLVMDPLLALGAIIVGMMISVRSSDIRVAQQLSGLAMLPVFAAASLTAFRIVEPSVILFVGAALVLGAADFAGWRILTGMFDRERLLTRYGPG